MSISYVDRTNLFTFVDTFETEEHYGPQIFHTTPPYENLKFRVKRSITGLLFYLATPMWERTAASFLLSDVLLGFRMRVRTCVTTCGIVLFSPIARAGSPLRTRGSWRITPSSPTGVPVLHSWPNPPSLRNVGGPVPTGGPDVPLSGPLWGGAVSAFDRVRRRLVDDSDLEASRHADAE